MVRRIISRCTATLSTSPQDSPGRRNSSLARHPKLNEFVTLPGANRTDPTIAIHCAPRRLLKIVAIKHIDFTTSDSVTCFNVEFDPGAYRSPAVAR